MDGLISFITSLTPGRARTACPTGSSSICCCACSRSPWPPPSPCRSGCTSATGKLALLGINIANIGRAIPSYAVMVMILPVALSLAPTPGYDPLLGLSFLPIFLAMVLLAIPPILVGAYAGLRDVDRDLVESARGMGLTERQILGRIEPLLAFPHPRGRLGRRCSRSSRRWRRSARSSAGGGLGRFIIDGISRRNDGMLYTGVLLGVGGLAIGVDIGMSWPQRRLRRAACASPRAPVRAARMHRGPRRPRHDIVQHDGGWAVPTAAGMTRQPRPEPFPWTAPVSAWVASPPPGGRPRRGGLAP
ncbi:MAG: ABC transporter permease subunit [Chloroflexota bacterium]